MHNRPPLQEQFGSGGWRNWFTQLFLCVPWKKALNVTTTLDFPSVLANSQSAALMVEVDGARQGDAVFVTPYSEVPGINYKAVVMGNDSVAVYAINFTPSAKDPGSMQFRIIVIQD